MNQQIAFTLNIEPLVFGLLAIGTFSVTLLLGLKIYDWLIGRAFLSRQHAKAKRLARIAEAGKEMLE